jgi:hypothetical protein
MVYIPNFSDKFIIYLLDNHRSRGYDLYNNEQRSAKQFPKGRHEEHEEKRFLRVLTRSKI